MEKKLSEVNLKRQLVEATDAVRKKFNMLKRNYEGDQQMLEKLYEPITKTLKMSAKMQTLKPPESPLMPSFVDSSTPIRKNIFEKTPTSSQKVLKTSSGNDKQIFENDNVFDRQLFEMDTPPTSSDDTSNITLQEVSKSPDNNSQNLNDSETLVAFHLQHLLSNRYDKVYGVRSENNKLYMGQHEIRFSNGKVSVWNGNKKVGIVDASPKLYDLIFLKEPSAITDSTLTDKDVKSYKKLVELTKVPYRDYNMRNGLNITKTRKFSFLKNLISPSPSHLRKISKIKKAGSGILKKSAQYKIYNNKPVNYVYWNNVKELVDRLRLLWSSKEAGHTGHDNEILSIIEELREEGVIY